MAEPTFAELVKMRAVLRLPGMTDVPVISGLVYKTIGAECLEADFYRPAGGTGDAPPLVVLVHGGPVPPGARPQKMGSFASIAQLLAVSGMAAVAFNHRFTAPRRLPEAAGDILDLLDYVRGRAPELGFDPERLAFWYFSGGGPFLSFALRDRTPFVRALVAYYPILDLRERVPEAILGLPDDFDDETRLAFSPAAQIAVPGPKVPPLLVARAGRDNPWINGTIDRFVAAALAANVPLDVLNHSDGRHAFDILDDDDRSRDILSRTLVFLRERLLSPRR